MSLVSYQHGVFQNLYHLVWATKYRYACMRKEKYRLAVRRALEAAASRHGIVFVELSVMRDHVHALVSAHLTMSASKALALLKGASAYSILHEFPNFRLRYPGGHFWSRGKCGRTVGDVDKEVVANYVRQQADQTNLAAY
ncbi:MAG: IS200/IS605 family transposase [Candidatus Diapherotrites archaeon]